MCDVCDGRPERHGFEHTQERGDEPAKGGGQVASDGLSSTADTRSDPKVGESVATTIGKSSRRPDLPLATR